MSSCFFVFLLVAIVIWTECSAGNNFLTDVLDWATDRSDNLLTKCYDDYGCFSIGGKFISVHRPINLFPASPSEIGVKFRLYTRSNPDTRQMLVPTVASLSKSYFRVQSPTKMIVHGFIEDGKKPWIKDMTEEFLKMGDFNIIAVDWSKGAVPPYTQAAANTRLVGAIIANFIQFLADTYMIPPQTFHIIGHSLGSHIAGYAGERLNKLGRISGLDPAQPYFEHTDPIVRLDPTDAIFVDVVHSDAISILHGGFGMGAPIGHLDFYPNGGQRQPGCTDNIIRSIGRENGDIYGGVRHYIGCNHMRAIQYYIESINPTCPFLAVECSSYEEYLAGSCFSCGINGEHCAPMGYHSQMWFMNQRQLRTNVKMFLKTGSTEPYCRYQHRVVVNFSESRARNDRAGRIFVRMTGYFGYTRRVALNDDDMLFQPGSTYMFVVSSPDAGPVQKMDLQWKASTNMLSQITWRVLGKPELQVTGVEVNGLETGYRTFFCVDDSIETETVRTVFAGPPCNLPFIEPRNGGPISNTSTTNQQQPLSPRSPVPAVAVTKVPVFPQTIAVATPSPKAPKSITSAASNIASTFFTNFLDRMLKVIPFYESGNSTTPK